MPCSACGAAASTNNFSHPVQTFAVPVNPNCPFNKTLLTAWKAILNCIKQTRKYQESGMSKVVVNQMAGIVQSAINYPDNYCYYEEQLVYFQSQLLPIIVTNVSECVS